MLSALWWKLEKRLALNAMFKATYQPCGQPVLLSRRPTLRHCSVNSLNDLQKLTFDRFLVNEHSNAKRDAVKLE